MTDVEVERTDATGAGAGDSGPDSSDAARRPRHGRWLLAVAVLLGGAGVIAWLALGEDRGDEDPAPSAESSGPPSLPPPVAGALDAEAEELVALLEAGRALTYHAIYDASGDPAVIGNELTLEVWHRGGRIRQDSRQVTDAATVETVTLLLADEETIACSRVDAADWSCSEQEESVLDVFGGVAGDLEGRDVTVTDEEVAGRAARCFTVPTDDGEITECLAEDGIPLRLSGPETELVLSELSDDVPDDAFTSPAEPVAGETVQ